ncbi:MAG: hypothetical protein IMW86_05020 [Hydrogenibacillus sp.]|nr:hypothetical protein [Hydrogenibacillus sp.]
MLPFDSVRRRMSIVQRGRRRPGVLAAKGAFEAILGPVGGVQKIV